MYIKWTPLPSALTKILQSSHIANSLCPQWSSNSFGEATTYIHMETSLHIAEIPKGIIWYPKVKVWYITCHRKITCARNGMIDAKLQFAKCK